MLRVSVVEVTNDVALMMPAIKTLYFKHVYTLTKPVMAIQ